MIQRLLFLIAISMISHTLFANPRIIGGKRTKPEDWPWMVALVYSDLSAEEGQFCGGSLIHPRWVLTANHCVKDETPESVEVVLGQSRLSREKMGERIAISQIIPHPNYDDHQTHLPPKADLALLKLAQPSHQPILRMANRYSTLQPGELATVMGWGSIAEYAYSDTYPDALRQTTVPLISNVQCNETQSYQGNIEETMLCAGFTQGGTDACLGDSGGPLVIENPTGWQQIGIVSYGHGCAQPHFYGVYTRLSAFQDFISQSICNETDAPALPQLSVHVDLTQVSIAWSSVIKAQGYQLYYAPYSFPIDETTLTQIESLNLNTSNHLDITLNHGSHFYVTVEAYQGNCYSGYSNLGIVEIP
jgi:secreted trypsin-like serine protease